MSKRKVAIILSGCGVYDGAEIHESVLTMLAIDRQGADYQCFAPDIAQHHVVNHLTGDEAGETRNVLVEAARIARGNIKPLAEYNVADFDALIMPGGFGAAKNLSSFAFEGSGCTVNAEVERALKETHAASKPIAALCIAPAVLSRVFGEVDVTIGNDKDTASALETLGSRHKTTSHGEVCLDETNKLVTSPCYMLDSSIAQIAEGADNAVRALLGLAG